MNMMISPELLKILACPVCKGVLSEQASELICQNSKCGLAYPVRGGIPILLADEARKLSR